MKKFKLFATIGILLLVCIYYYIALPAINIHSPDLWYFVMVLILLIVAIYVARKRLPLTEIRSSKTVKSLLVCFGVVVVVYLIGSLLSSPIVNAKKYQNLLKVESG